MSQHPPVAFGLRRTQGQDGETLHQEQVTAFLNEAEAAPSAAEVIRRHGVTPHTSYRWKAGYAGMEVSDAKRLRTAFLS